MAPATVYMSPPCAGFPSRVVVPAGTNRTACSAPSAIVEIAALVEGDGGREVELGGLALGGETIDQVGAVRTVAGDRTQVVRGNGHAVVVPVLNASSRMVRFPWSAMKRSPFGVDGQRTRIPDLGIGGRTAVSG